MKLKQLFENYAAQDIYALAQKCLVVQWCMSYRSRPYYVISDIKKLEPSQFTRLMEVTFSVDELYLLDSYDYNIAHFTRQTSEESVKWYLEHNAIIVTTWKDFVLKVREGITQINNTNDFETPDET